jgi:hypothetical protein
MFIRTLTATALVIPAIALSSAAYAGAVYQGGPKSDVTRAAASQTFETKKPYAQYVPGTGTLSPTTKKHLYKSGPNGR